VHRDVDRPAPTVENHEPVTCDQGFFWQVFCAQTRRLRFQSQGKKPRIPFRYQAGLFGASAHERLGTILQDEQHIKAAIIKQ
jgi:hypothetical protein